MRLLCLGANPAEWEHKHHVGTLYIYIYVGIVVNVFTAKMFIETDIKQPVFIAVLQAFKCYPPHSLLVCVSQFS